MSHKKGSNSARTEDLRLKISSWTSNYEILYNRLPWDIRNIFSNIPRLANIPPLKTDRREHVRAWGPVLPSRTDDRHFGQRSSQSFKQFWHRNFQVSIAGCICHFRVVLKLKSFNENWKKKILSISPAIRQITIVGAL